jgi:hypothetical protein
VKRDHAIALFEMAGFEVKSVHELPNGYWPDSYVELRRDNPWWLIETEIGLVKLGWRKRVISISWTNTPYRIVVTDDDTTKDEDMVHAWSYPKALQYLTDLKRNAK